MSLKEQTEAKVREYIATIKGTKITSIADAFQVITQAAFIIIAIMQASGATGAEKKDAAVAALLVVYDDVIAPADAPGPDFIVDPALRLIIEKGVGGVIEAALAYMKAKGLL